jgi:hypothetical protein
MAGLTSAASRLRTTTVLLVVSILAVAAAITAAPAGAATSSHTAPAAHALTGAAPVTPARTFLGPAQVTVATTYEECLTNDHPECVSLTGSEIAIIVGTTAGVASNVITGAGKVAIVYLVKKFLGWWDGPGSHTPTRLWSGYYEDGGDSGGAGANTNLCLADVSLASHITFQPCGADGTVWIEEPDNNGGNFNFSRYWVDNGDCSINSPGWDSTGVCEVMSAGSLSQGSPLFLQEPVASGGSLWQDWNP